MTPTQLNHPNSYVITIPAGGEFNSQDSGNFIWFDGANGLLYTAVGNGGRPTILPTSGQITFASNFEAVRFTNPTLEAITFHYIVGDNTQVKIDIPNSGGSADVNQSLPVVLPLDTTVTGPVAVTVGNNALDVANAGTNVALYASGSAQIIASAGIASGAVAFEQSNDGVNWTLLPSREETATAQTIQTGTITISASTNRIFVFATNGKFIRCRVSTTFVGGSIQVIAILSQLPLSGVATNVQQGTAANLNVTAALSAGTNLIGDVAGGIRSGTGGLTSNSRLVTAAATTNGTVVKASAGRVYSIRGYNNSATVIYLKFSNSTTITVGTTAVVDTFALKPNSEFSIDFENIGRYFSTGICYGLTTGVADNNTGALTAGDIVALNVFFV